MEHEEQKNEGVEAPASSSPLASAESPAELSAQKQEGLKARTVPLLAAALLLLAFGTTAALLARQSSGDKTDQAAQAEQRYDIPLIRIASEGPYDGYFPGMPAESIGHSELSQTVYEALVVYENASAKLVPQLATSWNTPDENTWEFKLKRDVKFHTGRTMTAEDVKVSMEETLRTERGKFYASTIERVDVVDEHRVRVITKGPDPVLLNRLTLLSIYDTKAADVKGPTNGTGPFTLKPGTVGTSEKVSLVAFDDYHGGRPNVRELQYTAVSDAIDAEFIAKGEFDFYYYVMSEDVPKLDPSAWKTYGYSTENISHIGMNNVLDSPLKDVRVRQALYHALEPQKIIDVRGSGGAVANQIVSEMVPGYSPEIVRPEHSVGRAKQLLAEAGYPNGVTLEFSYFAAAEPTVLEIQRQAALAGITIKLDRHDEVSTIGPKVGGGQAQLWWRNYGSDLYDATDIFHGYFNSPFYQDEEVNAKVAEAQIELDAEKRVAIMQEISKMLMEDVAWIPITVDYHIMVYRSEFKNFVKTQPGVASGVNWHQVYAAEPLQ